MPGKEKPPWPLTPEGVTDWEFVFEDPKTGFIALLGHATAAEALKDCAIVIVQSLFIRDDDGDNVMKFIIDLNKIFPYDSDGSDDFSAMQEDTTDLLRKIKDERKKKAEDYLAGKKSGDERRTN